MTDNRLQNLPIVTRQTTMTEAARLLADNSWTGLIVLDDDMKPIDTLHAVDVLRSLLPGSVVEEPSLARVLDQEAALEILAAVPDYTVGEILDDTRAEIGVIAKVKPEATTLAVAAELIDKLTLLAFVKEQDAEHPRFISASRVFREILALRGEESL